jgi:DNA-directed RNA polymerase II subunit RPB1
MGNEQSRPLAKDRASESAEPSSLKRQRSTSEDTPVRSTRQRRGTPSRSSIISVSSGSPVSANWVSPRRRANQPTVESDDEDSPERPAQDVALVPLLRTATPTRARSFASQSDGNVPPTSPGYAPTSPLYQGNLSPGNPPTSPYRGARSPAYSPVTPPFRPRSSASSPGYVPTSPPGPNVRPGSPAYSPTSPGYQGGVTPTSPRYTPTSPNYAAVSPNQGPASPNYARNSPANATPRSSRRQSSAPVYSPIVPRSPVTENPPYLAPASPGHDRAQS